MKSYRKRLVQYSGSRPAFAVIEELETLPRSIRGYVFFNPVTGKRWYDLKKVFDRARKAAGIGHVRFHDLRRSFVTNARKRGIPESVVMRMSGHKTKSVFERYNVVDEEDLVAAKVKLEMGRQLELQKQETETNRGTEDNQNAQ